MRILFITPYVPSLVRIRPFNFVKYLSTKHEVTLLALDPDNSSPEDVDLLRRYCSRVSTVRLSKAGAISNCIKAMPANSPLQAAYCWSPSFHNLIESELRQRPYDVAHVEHLRGAHFRNSIRGIPVVYDSVDCISLLLQQTIRFKRIGLGKALSWLELRRTAQYEARLMSKFHKVIVTSEEDRRALLRLDGAGDENRIIVVPNGVHLARSGGPNPERDSHTIVFSGKMSYHANIDGILHFCRSIFPLILAERPEVRLLIVGSNPPRQVRRLAANPQITVTGHVDDIRPFLEQATVAVCPLRYAVGIQNKVLEAMAMGTPVVATPQALGALGAFPGRDLLRADTPLTFAAHVLRLLGDESFSRRMSENARRYVEENHEWSRVVAKVEETYRGAVRGSRVPVMVPGPVPVSGIPPAADIPLTWETHND